MPTPSSSCRVPGRARRPEHPCSIRGPAGVTCCRAAAVTGPAWSRLIGVRVVVTQIAWDGFLRRRVLDTAGLPDAGRRETLIEQILAAPPPYRAAPARPVYVIHAGDRAIVAGEDNLTGPLRDLVTAILEGGSPA